MPRIKAAVALSVLGDRIEQGQEVEVSEEFLAALDPADYTLASEQPEEASEEQPADVTLDEMSSAQLKARAKELGLKASGSAADLRERIALHLEGKPTDGDEPQGEEEKPADGE